MHMLIQLTAIDRVRRREPQQMSKGCLKPWRRLLTRGRGTWAN